MKIRYRITVDHLYNGWPLVRGESKGDAVAYNPVALAMNAVHGDDAVHVHYDGDKLVAVMDDRTAELPGRLVKLLEAHAAGDTASAQPCEFNVGYATTPDTAAGSTT